MKSEKQIKEIFKTRMRLYIKEIKSKNNNDFEKTSSTELLFFSFFDLEIITRSTKKRYEKLIWGWTL